MVQREEPQPQHQEKGGSQWNAQQGQVHDEAANLNEAHHQPRGDASYNPDESVTNKHVQGRFIPPKAGNMPMQA